MTNREMLAQICVGCSSLGVRCRSNCVWAPLFKPDEHEKFSLLIEDTGPAIFKALVRAIKPDERQQFIDDQYKMKKEMKSEQEKAMAVLAADSKSLNQHKGKTVVDVADSLNRHEGKGVHDSGIGLKPLKCVPTSLSTKSCFNVAEDSLNHHEGKAVHDFCFKWGASKRICIRRQPTSQLLPLASFAEIFEAADILFEMANGVDQKAKAKQAEKEPRSLRNEKAEQSLKEEASLRNEKAEQAEKEQAERLEK